MTKVLAIGSSALGDASVSKQVATALIEEMQRLDGSIEVVQRDVGSDPIPHLSPERMAAFGGNTDTPPAAETAAISEAIIAEVMDADVLVIASPMYNFGITSTLKAWFDHLLRAGKTFRYTADGPVGLVTGKRAIVVEARGSLYSNGGPAAASDHQEPHLRTLLGFIGITDVAFVRAEGLAVSPEARAAGIEGALVEAREVAGRFAI